MPTLYVLQGPDKGRTLQTPKGTALIGRHSDQIQLSDYSISRKHAELRPANGAWILVDLGSSNGTFLNGRRLLTPMPLKHGDQIKVGRTLLVFCGDEEVGGFADPQMIRDLIDLEVGEGGGGSSILSAVDGAEKSVVLPRPETIDAVAAWNVVYAIAETLGTVESVDAFLERVVDILFEHLAVDHLVLLMFGAKRKRLEPRVVRFRGKGTGRRKPKITTSRTIIKHVTDTKEGVLCANALTDDRFGTENLQDSIHRFGLRSVICVPIIAHNEVQGVFHLDCSMSRHTYSQEHLRLAVAVGRLAGMAIDNARLLETRMRTERLAATGETVAYLSHHIRNILQGMQGGADVVELGLKKKTLETAASGWTLVRRNLDRIYHLTLNMLVFSKDRSPRIETANLNRIVEDALALAQARADERHVELRSELDDIPASPLDPEGVHQVAHNIILNAIDAAPTDSGRVSVRTSYDPGKAQVTLSVTDNGAGVAEEDRETIFDAFQSAKGQGGTGLGLAAAKKIVDELEGLIEIESTPDGGSTFHVHLPAVHVRLADSDKTHGPGT